MKSQQSRCRRVSKVKFTRILSSFFLGFKRVPNENPVSADFPLPSTVSDSA
jgi:hypothetical protein